MTQPAPNAGCLCSDDGYGFSQDAWAGWCDEWSWPTNPKPVTCSAAEVQP